MAKTVLILGASGKIGRNSAQAFEAAGWTVRRFVRGTDMNTAAMGCDVIVNGLNPPNYNNWSVLIPQITRDTIAAAKVSGATVILPGNVYNFGKQPAPWDENTPQTPCSRKGQIRVDAEAAYRASGVQTIVLRAGNFIDPSASDDVLSLLLLRSIKNGKISYPASFDIQQTYAYLPDWARAAVMLAEKRDALSTFEDVPFEGHAFTAAELQAKLEEMMDRKLKRGGFPWWLMTVLSPFWELARELREMRYLNEHHYWMSGEKLKRLLPDFVATPQAEVFRLVLKAKLNPD